MALILFITMGMTCTMFGAMLAIDMTRIIIVARQASNAAEAAAVAGAQQYQPGRIALESGRARNVARESLIRSHAVGAVDAEMVSTPQVVVSSNSYGSERVTVTYRYEIPGLVILPVLNAITDSDTGLGTFEVTREADVCVPGQYTPTGGSCVRPTLR